MTCGVRAPHTLQSSGLGGLDASGTLWLCYQTVLAHFQTPRGAGPPLAAPVLEAWRQLQVVGDGLTKEMTFKVRPEYEEGASGAKI